tara:strand:+ start:705 stop:1883 length:1179 start_codon:yes stop_codon:yes gene_type:complete
MKFKTLLFIVLLFLPVYAEAGENREIERTIENLDKTKNLISELNKNLELCTAQCAIKDDLKKFQAELKKDLNNIKLKELSAKNNYISTQLKQLFKDISTQVNSIASNPETIKALKEFSIGWDEMKVNQSARLQKLYISENPYRIGQKEKYDGASNNQSNYTYNDTHLKYHPLFRDFILANKYYDFLLIDLDGNIIYSVFKELDFATNIFGNKLSSPLLQEGINELKNNYPAKKSILIDIHPYPASSNAPMGYFAVPLEQENKLIGFLAVGLPIDKIDRLLQPNDDYNHNEYIYALGEKDRELKAGHKYLINKSMYPEFSIIADQKSLMNSDFGERIWPNQEGKPSLISYRNFRFDNINWYIMIQLSEEDFNQEICKYDSLSNLLEFCTASTD